MSSSVGFTLTLAVKLAYSCSAAGEDSGDVATTKLEDPSRLISTLNNTFLLASPSEFDSSTLPVYEISGISSEVVFQADPEIEEVTELNKQFVLS